MIDYTVYHDSIQTIKVRASSPNEAVRIARDAPLQLWQLTDKDDIEVEDADQEYVEFDWGAVEDLAGTPLPDGAGVITERRPALEVAARLVLDRWEDGDLAEAVRELDAALSDVPIVRPS